MDGLEDVVQQIPHQKRQQNWPTLREKVVIQREDTIEFPSLHSSLPLHAFLIFIHNIIFHNHGENGFIWKETILLVLEIYPFSLNPWLWEERVLISPLLGDSTNYDRGFLINHHHLGWIPNRQEQVAIITQKRWWFKTLHDLHGHLVVWFFKGRG